MKLLKYLARQMERNDYLMDRTEIELAFAMQSRNAKQKNVNDAAGSIDELANLAVADIPNIAMPFSSQYHDNEGTSYSKFFRKYVEMFQNSKEDMSSRVPLKWVNILPESQMGGILGFTYLGDNSMGRRADLTGQTARMVDIHESIHTPDEYETRVLTSWIMEKVKGKYVK